MQITVYQANQDDAEFIKEIERKTILNPWSLQMIKDQLNNSNTLNLVAKNGNKIIAYILTLVIPPEIEILSLAVSEKHRNQGIAETLIKELFELSKIKTCSRIILEVRSKNIPAINFYTKYGFETKGIRKNYYQNPTDDALIMWKENF